jgi:hypothetical protein
MPYNFFNEVFCKVYGLARGYFLASGGQPDAEFLQTYMKTIPRSSSSTVPNFIEIGASVWISTADTHIELYITY